MVTERTSYVRGGEGCRGHWTARTLSRARWVMPPIHAVRGWLMMCAARRYAAPPEISTRPSCADGKSNLFVRTQWYLSRARSCVG